MEKFNDAAKQFEQNIRQKRDLIEEMYTFLDDNYDAYLHATDAQRDEIQSLIGNTFYKGPDAGITHYMGNYIEALLFEYVTEHVLTQLKATGDEVWLTRGLVAISMENCCVDYRDTITCLAKLYVAGERQSMNPDIAFQRIAEISSKKTPIGGESSVSGMMATISAYEATNYERSIQ